MWREIPVELRHIPMFSILLIEDCDDDAFLLHKALEREGINSPVRRVENGKQAISYLQGEGSYSNRAAFPFPSVIFTDLKMPVLDGFGVLHWLKTHPECSVLPVMVFSASSDGADIERAYRLGANAYLVKPGALSELQRLVRTAHDFWLHCSKTKLAELEAPRRNN